MVDEESFRKRILRAAKERIKSEAPGWRKVGKKAKAGVEAGKGVGKKAFGGAKVAVKGVKESYDWEKEKRQAKAIGKGVATTAKVGAGAVKGTYGAGKKFIEAEWAIRIGGVLGPIWDFIKGFLPLIFSLLLGFFIFLKTNHLLFAIIMGIILFFALYRTYARTGKNIMVVFLLALILGGIFYFGNLYLLTVPGESYTEKFKSVWTNFGTVIKTPFTKIAEYQKKYEAALTGDYFTGQVDKNKHEPIGVYLENIKASDPYFYSDEPIIIWGTLNAKVLDEEVNVKLSCDIKGDKGEITPEFLEIPGINISSYEEEDFECTLPAQPKEALHIARVYADFNFKTMAYVKGYFIDKTRMRSMTREGIDILGQYGITDKNPIAVYSNGPVGIGMQIETGKQPIGIYTEPSKGDLNEISLGVTLNNRWEGAIEKITNLTIKVPEGLTIENYDCGREYIFMAQSCHGTGSPIKECEEGYKLYKLIGSKIPKDKNFETFKCNFGVDQNLELLGTTPISTRYFKVVAEYDYKLNKSTTVTVKKSETAVSSKLELIQKIVSESRIKNVPVDLALALAEQESGITHLKSDGSIVESSAGALGIMQIMPATGKIGCGMSLSDIYNADKNIECGLKILKTNYDNYKDGIDEDNIRKSCTDEEYIKKYADYRNWDAALRVYNGLGCPANAVNFVDQVNNRKSKYTSYK